MSIEFGDTEPDDVFDAEGVPEPEQVARRLHELRLARGREAIDWDALTASERLLSVAIVAALLAWLTSEGSL